MVEAVVLINSQSRTKEDKNDFWKAPEGGALSAGQYPTSISQAKAYAIASIGQDLFSLAFPFPFTNSELTGSIASAGKFS